MDYTISQKLNAYPDTENGWDDDITSTPQAGTFIAVTDITIAEGAAHREITVTLFKMAGMPAENKTNSGLFIRQEGETSVKATLVDQEGNELATNVVDYPS